MVNFLTIDIFSFKMPPSYTKTLSCIKLHVHTLFYRKTISCFNECKRKLQHEKLNHLMMIYIYILKMLFNISNWLFEYNIFLVKILPLSSNFVYSTGTELLHSTVNITVPWHWPALHTTESHWPETDEHCTRLYIAVQGTD